MWEGLARADATAAVAAANKRPPPPDVSADPPDEFIASVVGSKARTRKRSGTDTRRGEAREQERG